MHLLGLVLANSEQFKKSNFLWGSGILDIANGQIWPFIFLTWQPRLRAQRNRTFWEVKNRRRSIHSKGNHRKSKKRNTFQSPFPFFQNLIKYLKAWKINNCFIFYKKQRTWMMKIEFTLTLRVVLFEGWKIVQDMDDPFGWFKAEAKLLLILDRPNKFD